MCALQHDDQDGGRSLGFSDRRKTEIKLLPLSTRWFFSAQPECCDYVPQRILKKIKTVDRYLYKVRATMSCGACASRV